MKLKLEAEKDIKDRITILSDNIKKKLFKYMKKYIPKNYLFEGATGGKYSSTSLSKVIKQATKIAGINTSCIETFFCYTSAGKRSGFKIYSVITWT